MPYVDDRAALNSLMPARDFVAATPSDTVDQPQHRSVWVAAPGTVSIQNTRGQTVALGSLSAGHVIPGAVKRIMATGTTATLLLME